MIEEADRDGDGEISEDEFMRIMRKTNLFWARAPARAKTILDHAPPFWQKTETGVGVPVTL